MDKQAATIELYVLGTPHFAKAGQVVAMSNAKAKALLAYLALKQFPQARGHLAALLWSESSDEAARKNLRNVLWTIRSAFGDSIFEAHDQDRLSLSSGVWIDAIAFESVADMRQVTGQWRQALKLYRGLLLADTHLRDAPEFERWLTIERRRLESAYLDGLKVLLGVYRAEQQWDTLIDLAHDSLRHDPLQEEVHRLLIEAYAKLGKRAQAIQQYETLVRVLQQELDIQPLAETHALYDLIVANKFDSLPERIEVAPQPNENNRLTDSLSPFVGRDEALQQLNQALTATQQRHAQLVLISGEMGIGKSRLWTEWTQQHQADLEVLAAQSLPSTQSMPFFPLIEIFQTKRCMRQLFSVGSPLPMVWLTEVARLIPEIRRTLRSLPDPPPLSYEEERLRIFQALTQCLVALNERPLILFLDDIHWADRATLDWIGYLAHKLQHEALMLVLTYRSDEAAHLVEPISHWKRSAAVTHIQLGGLSPDNAAALLHDHEVDFAAIHQLSAGNPYYMLELSQSPDSVSSALVDITRKRLSQLPDMARQILQTAVIISPMLGFDLLKHVSGRSEDEVLDALETLMQNNILREAANGYQFVHPFFAEVMYAEMSATRRRILHRRAANEIITINAARLPQVAAQLVIHYEKSDQMNQAAHYAELAGDSAMELGALTEAHHFYDVAAAWESTPQRWGKLGRAQQLCGDLDEARANFDRAIQAHQHNADFQAMVEIELLHTELLIQSGQVTQAKTAAQHIVERLQVTDIPQLHTRALLVLGSATLRSGAALQEARHHFEVARTIADAHQLGAEAAYARFEMGNVTAQAGHLQQALNILAEAANNTANPDLYMAILIRNNRAYYAILADQLENAQTDLNLAFKMVAEYGLQLPLQYLFSTRGELALAQNQLDEAQEWFTHGLDEAQLNGNVPQVANYLANLSLVARERYDYQMAQNLLDEAEAQLHDLNAPFLRTQLVLWRAELWLHLGDQQQAHTLLQDIAQKLDPTKHGLLWLRLKKLQISFQ